MQNDYHTVYFHFCLADIKHCLLVGKTYTLGRRDCDITIEGDPAISRKHGQIILEHPEANLVTLVVNNHHVSVCFLPYWQSYPDKLPRIGHMAITNCPFNLPRCGQLLQQKHRNNFTFLCVVRFTDSNRPSQSVSLIYELVWHAGIR